MGIGAVNAQGKPRTVKQAAPPHIFLEDKTVKDVFVGVNRVLIGHNRFATQGAVNNQNAHPYMFDNIMGAHNGSLRRTELLPHHKDFEVDSQVLLNSIDKYGVEETEEKIAGAFALTWWDRRTNQLNFWRNDERPLWYCYTDDNKAIFWASEKEMLSFILKRTNLKHKEFLEVPAHKQLIFNINLGANQDVPEPVVWERKKYIPPYTAPSTNYGNWRGGRYDAYDRADEGYGGYSRKELDEVFPQKKQQPLRLVGGTSSVVNAREPVACVLTLSEQEIVSRLRKRVEAVLALSCLMG